MSEELLVVSKDPLRFSIDSTATVSLEMTADEGDIDRRAPVVPTLPEMDTNGPTPPDCKLSLPLFTLIPSPSSFLCWSLAVAPKLFADLSDISLGGPVTDARDIFSSSNSTAPSLQIMKIK